MRIADIVGSLWRNQRGILKETQLVRIEDQVFTTTFGWKMRGSFRRRHRATSKVSWWWVSRWRRWRRACWARGGGVWDDGRDEEAQRKRSSETEMDVGSGRRGRRWKKRGASRGRMKGRLPATTYWSPILFLLLHIRRTPFPFARRPSLLDTRNHPHIARRRTPSPTSLPSTGRRSSYRQCFISSSTFLLQRKGGAPHRYARLPLHTLFLSFGSSTPPRALSNTVKQQALHLLGCLYSNFWIRLEFLIWLTWVSTC